VSTTVLAHNSIVKPEGPAPGHATPSAQTGPQATTSKKSVRTTLFEPALQDKDVPHRGSKVDAKDDITSHKPGLEPPLANLLAGEGGETLLAYLVGRTSLACLEAIKTRAMAVADDLKVTNDRNLKQIRETIKKIQEAERKKNSFWGKLFRAITKIAAILISAIALATALAVTGPAAIPLIMLAGFMFVTTAGNEIAKLCGSDIDLSAQGVLKTLVTATLKLYGVPEESIEKIVPILNMVIVALLACAAAGATLAAAPGATAGAVVGSAPDVIGAGIADICKKCGVDSEIASYICMAVTVLASLCGNVAAHKLIKKYGGALKYDDAIAKVNAAAGVADAAASAGSAGVDISVAVTDKQVAESQAESRKYQAFIAMLQAMFAALVEELSNARKAYNAIFERVSDMVKDRIDTNIAQAQNVTA
jgi:hypothetical protein